MQTADKLQPSFEQLENETAGAGSILNLAPNMESMSLSRQISKIIDFWEGDIDEDEIMLELEKISGQPSDSDNTKALVASVLKRKSRFINTK